MASEHKGRCYVHPDNGSAAAALTRLYQLDDQTARTVMRRSAHLVEHARTVETVEALAKGLSDEFGRTVTVGFAYDVARAVLTQSTVVAPDMVAWAGMLNRFEGAPRTEGGWPRPTGDDWPQSEQVVRSVNDQFMRAMDALFSADPTPPPSPWVNPYRFVNEQWFMAGLMIKDRLETAGMPVAGLRWLLPLETFTEQMRGVMTLHGLPVQLVAGVEPHLAFRLKEA